MQHRLVALRLSVSCTEAHRLSGSLADPPVPVRWSACSRDRGCQAVAPATTADVAWLPQPRLRISLLSAEGALPSVANFSCFTARAGFSFLTAAPLPLLLLGRYARARTVRGHWPMTKATQNILPKSSGANAGRVPDPKQGQFGSQSLSRPPTPGV